MELVATLRTTGAVRRFRAEPVTDAALHQVLDDARFAPSGGNRQPWKVAVVRDVRLRRQLADMMQPVWDAYVARAAAGVTPYNPVDDVDPEDVAPAPNELLEEGSVGQGPQEPGGPPQDARGRVAGRERRRALGEPHRQAACGLNPRRGRRVDR